MKPFAKWALVGTAGVLIGAFLMNASGTFAVSSSSGNGAAPSQSQATGDQIQLTPGQSASVACSGTKLSWTQIERKDGVATCTSRSTATTSTTSTTTGSNPPPTECPQFLTAPKAAQAFCDTMGTPDPVANTRSGDLNGVVWGVSRLTGNNTTSDLNIDPWADSIEDVCGTKTRVSNLDDINICNGQMVEASDDSGSQTVLAMYPRQPFNFAGRTGVVEFNVSDNSESSHTAWPTFAITDQPIPDPDLSTQVGFEGNNPRNGIEIDFFGNASSSPHCVYANVAAVSNYQQVNVPQTDSGCVLAAPNKEIVKTTLDQNGDNNGGASSGVGKMNHVEIAISSTGLQVYMSNAGTTNMQLVTTANFSVPLTQGLVWLEDQHYNGDKFSEDQQTNTFAWSDVAFDGPVEPRDLGFDAARQHHGRVQYGHQRPAPDDPGLRSGAVVLLGGVHDQGDGLRRHRPDGQADSGRQRGAVGVEHARRVQLDNPHLRRQRDLQHLQHRDHRGSVHDGAPHSPLGGGGREEHVHPLRAQRPDGVRQYGPDPAGRRGGCTTDLSDRPEE